MDHTYANRATGDGAARQDWFCKDRSALNSQLPAAAQALPLLAELIGSDTCVTADTTARGYAPVLTLCRQLLAAGLDPDAALTVYRNGTLALRVRSIGEAAGLEVNAKGTGFVRTASPVRRNGGGGQ